MPQHPHPLPVHGRFDRDASTRASEQLLDEAWGEPGTRLLRLSEGKIPLRAATEDSAELDLVPVVGERSPQHYFLGRVAGDAIFAVDTDADATAADATGDASLRIDEPVAGWKHPFSVGVLLPVHQQELMIVALALSHWHRSMPFSPRDAEATTPTQGGWARIDAHGGEHFPRTDPAVIVLVEHENRLLLGSNVLWETGRFSLLAGFVEAGESAEQAVTREIFEECGLEVGNVRYVASQAWPFPRSLMLGFRVNLAAGADPEALVPDVTEISELRWFTRDDLRNPAPGIILPRKLSIARKLLDLWVAEGDSV